MTREYESTRQLDVAVILDMSHSMHYGRKVDFAMKVADVVLQLALNGGDAASLAAHDFGSAWRGPITRSRNGLPHLLKWLVEASSEPGSDSHGHAAELGALARSRSLAFWVSDFMFDSVDTVLGEWRSRGVECVCVHVLASDEREPRTLGKGSHRLQDSETNQGLLVDLSPTLLKSYEQELVSWMNALEMIASGHDAWYFPVTVGTAVDSLMAEWSRRGLLT